MDGQIKSDFIRGKPILIVQQLGRPARESDPIYDGCLQLREYIDGCDYFDQERNSPVATIVRRSSDQRIFSVPDYRFCKNPAFRVLWLHERRRKRPPNVE